MGNMAFVLTQFALMQSDKGTALLAARVHLPC